MNPIKYFSLLILFVFSITVSAKNASDSLWNAWSDHEQPDSNRIKAIYFMSAGQLSHNPDSAFLLAQLFYDFAERENDSLMMGNALNIQGISFYNKGEYVKALEYYEKALIIRKAVKHQKGIASSLNNLGLVYADQGNSELAIEHYMRSVKIKEELNDEEGVARTISNIGMIHYEMDNLNDALVYFKKSYELSKRIEYEQGKAFSLNNMGMVFSDQKEFDKSQEVYEKSLVIKRKLEDDYGVANTLNNIGSVYIDQDKLDEAADYYHQALDLAIEIGIKDLEATCLNNIALVFFNKGDLSNALIYSTKSYQISIEIGAIKDIISASKLLYEIYNEQNNFEKAYEMYATYVTMSDSIKNVDNQRELIRQQYKYDYEKKVVADSIRQEAAKKVTEEKLAHEQTQRYALYGGLALLMLFGGFMYNRFRITRNQKQIIEIQKEQVEEKNHEILASINYAKRLQNAILPPNKLVKEHLKDSFILYKPKDIVAGDFYWLVERDNTVYFAAADCTGHGVPGAMVSVLCNNGLNRSVREYGITDPGKILDRTREIVIQEFEKSESEVKDGMDIALCSIKGSTLKYAGAHNPLWVIRDGQILETKADKQPIGQYHKPFPFTTHNMELIKGDCIYIFSDGYVDQFGGEFGKKFMAKKLKSLLLEIQDESMEKQFSILDQKFEDWKGQVGQVDDVCVIGVKV